MITSASILHVNQQLHFTLYFFLKSIFVLQITYCTLGENLYLDAIAPTRARFARVIFLLLNVDSTFLSFKLFSTMYKK